MFFQVLELALLIKLITRQHGAQLLAKLAYLRKEFTICEQRSRVAPTVAERQV
jgi:hypothetical protein